MARDASSSTATSTHPLVPGDSDDVLLAWPDERKSSFTEGKIRHEPERLQESVSMGSSCVTFPPHTTHERPQTLQQLKDQCRQDKMTARQQRRQERLAQMRSQPETES